MSRLKTYITEAADKTPENELLRLLTTQCKPFLKELKSTKTLIWRGVAQSIKEYRVIVPRKDRKPRDMPVFVSDMLDKAFQKHHGWKPRSTGVFTTTDYGNAYDNPYLFFPIGKYKYLWSKEADDLYLEMDQRAGTNWLKRDRDELVRNIKRATENYGSDHMFTRATKGNLKHYDKAKVDAPKAAEDIVQTYIDSTNYHKSDGNEITFKVSKYILVNESYLKNNYELNSYFIDNLHIRP